MNCCMKRKLRVFPSKKEGNTNMHHLPRVHRIGVILLFITGLWAVTQRATLAVLVPDGSRHTWRR